MSLQNTSWPSDSNWYAKQQYTGKDEVQKEKNRCPWRISATEMCGSCLLSGSLMTMGTYILHYLQQKTQLLGSWLVSKWLTLFFHLCEKISIAFSSPQVIFQHSTCCSCYKKMRWTMSLQTAAPAVSRRIMQKIQIINKLEPTSKFQDFRISTALKYTLIIHTHRVNTSVFKSYKWFRCEKANTTTKRNTNKYWKLALIPHSGRSRLQTDSSPTVHIAFPSSQLPLVK